MTGKIWRCVGDLMEMRLYLSGRTEKNHEILSHVSRVNFEFKKIWKLTLGLLFWYFPGVTETKHGETY